MAKKTIKKRRKGAPVITQIGRGKTDKHDYKMMLAEKQNYICPLCKRDFSQDETKSLHLDHDHKNGMVRACLCGNCNRAEGKINNIVKRFLSRIEVDLEGFIRNLVKHWEYYDQNPSNVLFPDYKTPFDKKEATRVKAAKKRLEKKNAKKNNTKN